MLVHSRQLVQHSFAALAVRTDHAALIFYSELFCLEPRLRVLFSGELLIHGRQLIQMIGATVRLLDQPERLRELLQQLGRENARIGLAIRDYDSVGLALIRTLERVLGPAFTHDVRAAWIQAYRKLATTMIDAAKSSAVAA